jgi:hypothetical protein
MDFVPLARSATVRLLSNRLKAIFAFSAASIFRLDLFMIRPVYHDGTASAPTTPVGPKSGVHFSGAVVSNKRQKRSKRRKATAIKFDHHVCRIRCLGLHAKQVT